MAVDRLTFVLGGLVALALCTPPNAEASDPTSLCRDLKWCDEALEVFFGGKTDEALAVARDHSNAPSPPFERRIARDLLRVLTHAGDLLVRADRARQGGDADAATALQARYVLLARRLVSPERFSEKTRELVPAMRVAYLDLAEQLLQKGRGGGARRAFLLAASIDPTSADVKEFGLQLEEVARAAYLRGYGVYRDGGLDAMATARRLWQFTVAATPGDSETSRKAKAMLEETAQ